MSKHKKTREQKIIADLKRKLMQSQIYEYSQPVESKPSQSPKESSGTPLINTSYISPAYVIKDLRNTAFITGALLATQLMLFFMLKKHILTLPGLQF